MISDPLLYVIAAAILISAAAMVLQAGLLLGMYKSSKATREQVVLLAGHVERFVESAQSTFEQSRKQISDVMGKAAEVLELAHKQLVRIDAVLVDATARAQVQMDRAEVVVDDALNKLEETVTQFNKGFLRPVREMNAVVAGFQAGLRFLFRGRRLSVEQATHDEEMFI